MCYRVAVRQAQALRQARSYLLGFMRDNYLRTLVTPSVERAQVASYGRSSRRVGPSGELRPFGASELEFIGERDSFYMATVGETGWPYMQHRGGAKGFLRVLDSARLAFADYAGNRQLVSVGNLEASDKVSLFLMDYPARERLKLIGHASILKRGESLELDNLFGDVSGPPEERYIVISVIGYDWNCPKHIVPRYTTEDVGEVTRPLRARIAELEAELRRCGGG